MMPVSPSSLPSPPSAAPTSDPALAPTLDPAPTPDPAPGLSRRTALLGAACVGAAVPMLSLAGAEAAPDVDRALSTRRARRPGGTRARPRLRPLRARGGLARHLR